MKKDYFLEELSNLKNKMAQGNKNIDFFDYMNFAFDIRVPSFWQPIVEEMPNKKRIMILLPPGHRKTTTIVGYAAWALGTRRKLRIGIATHTVDYSSVILNQICEILDSPQSIELIGKVIPENPEYNTKGWTKKERWIYEDRYIKDPNLVAIGVGSNTIGFRLDLIIADDVCTQNNTMTPIMRNKISSWFWGALAPRLEPDGQIIVTGSRFYEGDLYDEILRQKDDWDIHVLTATPEKPLWPARFDSGWLKQKLESNPLFFRSQYMQIPIKEKCALDPAWLHFHYSVPDNLQYFIGVDPCDKPDGMDSFALAVIGIDQARNAYLVDGTKKQIDVLEQAKEILWYSSRYKPIAIAIEDRGALYPLLRDSKLNVRIVRYSIPKTIRIQRLSEEFKLQRITLPMITEETPAEITKAFINEWKYFGASSSHDDLLDAVYNAYMTMLEGGEAAISFRPAGKGEGLGLQQPTSLFTGVPRIWTPELPSDLD